MKKPSDEQTASGYVPCLKMKNGGRRHRIACHILQAEKYNKCPSECPYFKKEIEEQNASQMVQVS